MDLTKKTTILFPPDLHERLTQRAAREGTSLGELVRRACRSEYGLVSREERVRAVEAMLDLELPVADPSILKRESVPDAEDLLPAAGPAGDSRDGEDRPG